MIDKDRRYYNPFHNGSPDPNKRHFIVSSTVAAVASLGAAVGGSLALAGPLTFGTSLAIGAGTLAAGGAALYGATKLIGSMAPKGPKQFSPSVPSPVPSGSTLEAESAKRAKEKTDATRRSIARNKTIYTKPTGVTAFEKRDDTQLKTLFGQ